METTVGEGMFLLGKQIGGGSFGTIFEGDWREGKKKVAIKMEPVRS